MAKSSLDKMKERLKKSSPKISGRANLENMNQIRNFVFGKSKKMGTEDDVQGISLQKAKRKIANNKNKTKKPLGKSPGALGGKIKKKSTTTGDVSQGSTIAKNKIGSSTVKKDKTGQAPTKTGKVKATAANTKNYASTLAMQKRLKKLGANINADGIMGPKTRAAIKKYIKNPSTLKKKVMVDDFKKSKVKKSASKTGIDGAATTKKKSSKTGLGSKAMSTKTPKTYKGTNITPTKLQRERMRKRMMGST